jgi:hypothetical protein
LFPLCFSGQLAVSSDASRRRIFCALLFACVDLGLAKRAAGRIG